jgi:hypothetical protein
MLSTAIILPGDADTLPLSSLHSSKGVEWEGIFYAGQKQNHTITKASIFSSPEIMPRLCDLLIVIEPDYCNYDYLSFAIRNGCHLFLSDKLRLTIEERSQLIHLANEGGTYIEVQNDFLFHPFQEKIKSQSNRTCFIEVTQSAPSQPQRLNELLSNNLLMILRAADSQLHKFNVFCGTVPLSQPDILNVHIQFKNASVASLTLKFIEPNPSHILSIYTGGEITTFDFGHDKINHYPVNEPYGIISRSSPDPLQEQIADFVRNIAEKNSPGFSLHDEIQVFQLIEKIKEKIEFQSFKLQ